MKEIIIRRLKRFFLTAIIITVVWLGIYISKEKSSYYVYSYLSVIIVNIIYTAAGIYTDIKKMKNKDS